MQIRFNRPQSLAHQALRPGHSVSLAFGRGIGKSYFLRVAGWYLPVAQWDGLVRHTTGGQTIRGVRVINMLPTFKQARDVHEKPTIAETEGDGPWSWLKPKTDHTRWLLSFPGGSTLQWFGAREADGKRGLRGDIVTVDEADDIDPEVFDAIVEPWLSEPWSLRMVLLGGTPRRGRYGLLYREYKAGQDAAEARRLSPAEVAALPEERQREIEALRHRYSFHATWRDAPETVDQGYVERIRTKLVADGKEATYRREWECDFDSAEGLVYSHFDERAHVRVPPPSVRFSEFLVGVDHGWEDPGVFLVFGVQGQGEDAVLWLLEEVYEPHKLEEFWIAEAQRVQRTYAAAPIFWYGDPSRPDRIQALRNKAGARFPPTDERINSLEAGVSTLASRLALRPDPDDPEGKRRLARFYVHPRCVRTRWEFANYRRKRDPHNADRFLDIIEDKNNHAMDAARYACFGRFGRAVRSVTQSGAGW